jgi:hypothetical protein
MSRIYYVYYLLILIFCLISPPIYPQESNKKVEAKLHFEKGVNFMKEKNYDAALLEFQYAYELLPNPLVLFNIGMCLKEKLRYADAVGVFKRVISESGVSIDKGLKSEVEKIIGDLQNYVGYIVIEGEYPDARLYIDDTLIGNLPFKEPIPVDIGKHRLEVTREGYKKFERSIVVRSNEEIRIPILLERIVNYGRISISSSVPNAIIEIDNEKMGSGTVTANLPEGEHRINVMADGYREFSCIETIKPDQEKKVNAHLLPEPPPSKIEVKINTPKATLRLDGKEKTSPPITIWGVKPGTHTIEVKKEGMMPISANIDIQGGQEIYLDVELNKESHKLPKHWFWISLSLSVASYIGSLLYYISERDIYNNLENYSADRRERAIREGEDAKKMSTGLFFTGAGLTATTITLYFFTDFSPLKPSIYNIRFSNLNIQKPRDCYSQSEENMRVSGEGK